MRFALGQYVPGDSFVHRLDPRTKMGLVAAFVGMLLAVQSWWGYGAATAMVGLGVAASRVSAARLVRGLRPLWWFVVLSVVFHAFWTEGHPLVRWGPLAVTREGLQQAAMTSLRLVLLVAGASLLTLTTSPLDLTEGLERLLTPGRRLGLPAHELAMTMTIALRFVPTLLEEADRIMKAQMARGAAFDRGGPLRRATALLPLLVPLFVSALRRADELAVAMEARCYRGGQGRTRLRQLRMGRR
ncbi:MAG TPA: energy-coupling factor transporter transmembrane protein EcfT, partial [Limnochordales bacterium]